MTALTMVLQEREDIFVESGLSGRRLTGSGRGCGCENESGQEKNNGRQHQEPCADGPELLLSDGKAYARNFPPNPSTAVMICADHCTTSSSRSVCSAD
jgi:hypothetical protein